MIRKKLVLIFLALLVFFHPSNLQARKVAGSSAALKLNKFISTEPNSILRRTLPKQNLLSINKSISIKIRKEDSNLDLSYVTFQNNVSYERYIKYLTIKNFLEEKNSPLLPYSHSFVNSCFRYKVNCYLLPAIAGVESNFGKRMIKRTHNPFGWGKGKIFFDSYPDAIDEISFKLETKYLDKGAVTLEQVGMRYAGNTNWSHKVKYFMNKMEEKEKYLRETLETFSTVVL